MLIVSRDAWIKYLRENQADAVVSLARSTHTTKQDEQARLAASLILNLVKDERAHGVKNEPTVWVIAMLYCIAQMFESMVEVERCRPNRGG